ncbi:hypothetical protein EVAR_102452_1 [Eumeta japonica]|uniref:Uncharacterized protein n=1 Tax=Eumeta variegata TaxID=151549 RepID=A0A4C1ZS39_EUMVA|nr:hypothetical protein EVAR_102452_1 [Eumeta japonica]
MPQSDAALDVEHLSHASFLVAGAQAHEAYRTIGSITVMYGPHDLGLRPTSPWPLGLSPSFGQHHRFDGANLNLFLTPQRCTRAKRGWPPPRSAKPTVRRTWDHIIRERLHVYAEFPEFSGRESGSGSKGWTGYRTATTL